MNRTTSLLKGVAGAAGIAAVALIAGGVLFSNAVVRPKRYTLGKALQYQIENGLIEAGEYKGMRSKPFTVASPFGYALRGQWFEPEGTTSDKAVKAAATL